MANRIKALDQMSAINASSFPHSKEKWRDLQQKQLREIAYPRDEREPVNMEDFARIISGGGNV